MCVVPLPDDKKSERVRSLPRRQTSSCEGPPAKAGAPFRIAVPVAGGAGSLRVSIRKSSLRAERSPSRRFMRFASVFSKALVRQDTKSRTQPDAAVCTTTLLRQHGPSRGAGVTHVGPARARPDHATDTLSIAHRSGADNRGNRRCRENPDTRRGSVPPIPKPDSTYQICAKTKPRRHVSEGCAVLFFLLGRAGFMPPRPPSAAPPAG